MKLKSLLLIFCLSLLSSAYADNIHVHPKVGAVAPEASSAAKKAMMPGYCQIEIINNSYDNVTVSGHFVDNEDNAPLEPFNVYRYGAPHYIHLNYYGYCHDGMYLNITTFSHRLIYSGYTRRDSTIRIVPYLGNQVKAEVNVK